MSYPHDPLAYQLSSFDVRVARDHARRRYSAKLNRGRRAVRDRLDGTASFGTEGIRPDYIGAAVEVAWMRLTGHPVVTFDGLRGGDGGFDGPPFRGWTLQIVGRARREADLVRPSFPVADLYVLGELADNIVLFTGGCSLLDFARLCTYREAANCRGWWVPLAQLRDPREIMNIRPRRQRAAVA